MNWLHRWRARRELRRVVPWDSCAWSPKKAAEKRFIQVMTEHYKAMNRIHMDAATAALRRFLK